MLNSCMADYEREFVPNPYQDSKHPVSIKMKETVASGNILLGSPWNCQLLVGREGVTGEKEARVNIVPVR